MPEAIVMKSDGTKTIEQIRAEVAAFEANPVDPGAPNASTAPTETPVSPVVTPEPPATPKPETPSVTEPVKADQQPKETPGQAASEPPKAAEPVKDWEAAYKGLQAKYNKAFVENKAGAQVAEVTPIAPPVTEAPGVLTPESRKQFASDVDKDPVYGIEKLVVSIIQREIGPIKSKVDATEAEKIEASRIANLERLVSEGHDWLKTPDGIRKMEAALSANPELWKTRDPYRAAMGFIPDIPSKAGQRGSAQSTGLTPILGASGAMPPAVSTPAVSKAEKLEGLMKEVQLLQSRGNWPEANKKLAEMDAIDRGWK